LDNTTDTQIVKDDSLIYLIINNTTDYIIVRSEDSSNDVTYEAANFTTELRDKTNVEGLTIKVDWYKTEDEIMPHEILIGDTNRPETATVKESISKIGGNTFIIAAVGEKIVIYGTNDNNVALAIQYFLDNYVIDNGDGYNTLTVPKSLYYQGDIMTPTPSIIINTADSFTTSVTKIMDIPKDGNFKVLQGGCTDGKYVYSMLENQTVSPSQSKIVKIDSETWEIVKTSDEISAGHSNDMTYNSKTNQILIVHNAPDRELISIFDADTFEFIKTVTLSVDIYSISYNEANDRYVIGLSYGYNLAILDSDFKVTQTFTGKDTGNTTQGVDSDDTYIYFVMYNTNTINVYDWSGHYIMEIPLVGISVEPENIFHFGEQLYVCCYVSGNGGRIYKVDLIPQ